MELQTPEQDASQDPSPLEELSLTDKISGVLTAPNETFRAMADQPLKKSHWALMLLFMIAAYIGSSILLQSNAEIKYQIKQKIEQKRDQTARFFDGQIKKGQLTAEQKEQGLKGFDEQVENVGTPKAMLTQSLWVTIGLSIQFFVVALFFYFCARFFFGAEFKTGAVYTVLGMALVVNLIEVACVTIYVLLTEKLVGDFSVATLMSYESHDITGFFLGKLNLFSLWYFFLVGTGLAGMAKSEARGKYYILVFASWIAVGLIWFGITKAVPFLSPN